jgi:glycerophosphoryl diester phosphodiesterase
MSTTSEATPPLVIAHRGASARAPENTIAAFELALELGADAIALEVHLSRDGHPVVIHDFSLERTTDGTGPVGDRTVRELKRLDAGGWLARRFRGQRIQTLLEVLERFRDRARFWIELAGGSDLYPGLEEKVVSAIEIYEVVERSLLQSFDVTALLRIRALAPDLRLGALVDHPPLDPAVFVPGLVQAICPSAHLLSEGDAARIRQGGLGCYVWTVNEPAQMDRLVTWGVSGIVTDQPEVLRARVGR